MLARPTQPRSAIVKNTRIAGFRHDEGRPRPAHNAPQVPRRICTLRIRPVHPLRRHLQGLPVYFLGSGLALALDTAVLMLALRQGLALPWATSVGFLSGMGVSYAISVRYAFNVRTLRNPGVEFASFVLIGLAGLLLTQLLLWTFVGQLGWPVLAAKALTACFVFSFNYSLRKWLLFTRVRPVRPS
ncbi:MULTISPECIES: GtrA family protein [Roseateles]|uniref:GtrA family protein n=1 Tax=Roseateles TaxID=93681 RepID=UPI002E17ADB0|nr:GtrA family protein [Roseateles sp.]